MSPNGMNPLFDRFRTKGIFFADVQCSKAFPYNIGHYLRIYVSSVVAIVFFCVF